MTPPSPTLPQDTASRLLVPCAILGTVALLAVLLSGCPGTSGMRTSQPQAPLTAGGQLGHDCVVDGDCATGMCDRTIPGGYCTRPCRASEDCGRRGWCDWDPTSMTGYCMQRCENQRECRSAEFECFTVPGTEDEGVCAWLAHELAPTEPNIGAPCRADVECLAPGALDAVCLPERNTLGEPSGYTGGTCIALRCTDDASCGPGARCATQGRTRFCAPACDDAEDCREGYACAGEPRVCAPIRR